MPDSLPKSDTRGKERSVRETQSWRCKTAVCPSRRVNLPVISGRRELNQANLFTIVRGAPACFA
jgi:hypothetical protein